MKTEFELQALSSIGLMKGKITIIGERPDNAPYVNIEVIERQSNATKFLGCIKDRDLERFAVNILKALKSKKLKQ